MNPINESESYPSDWAKVILLVSPKGEMHAIGGARALGDPRDDLPYIGLQRIKDKIADLESTAREYKTEAETMRQEFEQLGAHVSKVVIHNLLDKKVAKLEAHNGVLIDLLNEIFRRDSLCLPKELSDQIKEALK